MGQSDVDVRLRGKKKPRCIPKRPSLMFCGHIENVKKIHLEKRKIITLDVVL